MKFDYSVLRARIKERFGTYRSFAAALGVSDRTLRRWLQCEPTMSVYYCRRMIRLLNIPNKDIDAVFFTAASAG